MRGAALLLACVLGLVWVDTARVFLQKHNAETAAGEHQREFQQTVTAIKHCQSQIASLEQRTADVEQEVAAMQKSDNGAALLELQKRQKDCLQEVNVMQIEAAAKEREVASMRAHVSSMSSERDAMARGLALLRGTRLAMVPERNDMEALRNAVIAVLNAYDRRPNSLMLLQASDNQTLISMAKALSQRRLKDET